MSVAMVGDEDWQDVWNTYMDWVMEEKQKREEEEKVRGVLPVRPELLRQKVRDW